MPQGLPVFVGRQGFTEIQFDNNKVVNQEDIPEDVKQVLEQLEREQSPTTAIRKLYYKSAVSWFYIMRK